MCVRLLIIFNGGVAQGLVGKGVQEGGAADAQTDARHSDAQRVCTHRCPARTSLSNVVQHREGAAVRGVRPVGVGGVGTGEYVQLMKPIPRKQTTSFICNSTVGTTGRVSMPLSRSEVLSRVPGLSVPCADGRKECVPAQRHRRRGQAVTGCG